MASRGQKLKLGIFLLSTGAALVLLLVAFLGVTLWESVEHYHVLVPDSIEGLERGAPVKIRGVRVGRVGDFELNPNGVPGVRVTLEIKSGVRVSSDARAFVKFQGLTGIKLVDLVEGSPEAPPLPPGSYISYGETALQKITDRADELVERSVILMERADQLLARLVEVADTVEVKRLESSFENADRLLLGLTQTNASLGELIRAAQQQLGQMSAQTGASLKQADELLASATAAMDQLGHSSRELQGIVRGSSAPLRTTLYNLRAASESFKELGRTLAQQPSTLLFSDAPPERELP